MLHIFFIIGLQRADKPQQIQIYIKIHRKSISVNVSVYGRRTIKLSLSRSAVIISRWSCDGFASCIIVSVVEGRSGAESDVCW